MRHLLAILFLAAAALPAQAGYTIYTSKHTYHIDVQNSAMRDIWGAWVNVYESGDHSATVNVRADGYRDVHGYANISPNQQHVYLRVTMQDPTVWVRVTDRLGQQISGAYVDQNQFMANADEYRLEVRMPSTGFTKFQRQHVQVDGGWGSYINVWGSDSAKRVEIRIPRRSMGSSWSHNIRVSIPTDEQLQRNPREVAREEKFQKLHGE